jgi:general secretion pathway protein M
MIQVVPDQKNSKTTAIMLLVIVFLLVYLLVFHWFILRHLSYADELGELRTQLNRFQLVASQRESLQSRLDEVRSSQADAAMFLGEPEFDEAAAAMSSKLQAMVRMQAADSCQIVSRQPVRARVEERFQKVTVNVRMRCDAEDLMQVLYQMESSLPLMLVDDLNVIRPRARQRNRGAKAQTQAQGTLDIRFNVSGYLQ